MATKTDTTNAKARKKMVMEVGRKYDGKGWINEYGQTFFECKQSAEKPNNMKLVKENDTFSLYESKNFLKISVKIAKEDDKFAMIRNFMTIFQEAVLELKNYNTQ